MAGERSQSWLRATLHEIWDTYFRDVPVANSVQIDYFRPSRSRLGWIALSESGRYTHIGINRLLRYPEAPDAVCVITIAHELVHYGHGFGSPLPRRFADPHAGGIVDQELAARGLGDALAAHQEWTAEAWHAFYERQQQLNRNGARFRGAVADRADTARRGAAALELFPSNSVR